MRLNYGANSTEIQHRDIKQYEPPQKYRLGMISSRPMIYIDFVELYCLMLHTKFQNHRPSGSGDFLSFCLLFIAMVAIMVM